MKLEALITALVLSTSSVALAKPVLDRWGHIDADLSLRDQRGPWRPTWAPLTAMIRSGGHEQIRVAENRDNLTSIRLQHGTGATYVYSVVLRFEDGTREKIDVGAWLYSNRRVLTFDLPQHRGGIDQIVVSTWAWRASTYRVMGKQMRRIVPPPRPLPPPPPQAGLVVGTDLTFANTDGYVHVPVGSAKGRFSKLRIESTGPSTYIGHVHVTYATGAHQTIPVDKAFYRGEVIDLDLQGKGPQAVTAITLMAHGDVRAVGPSASRFDVILR